MRLIRCHIENFGRLHDVTIEFERDFHLICAPNGWGKSTLAAFVRVMFFGFEGESRRKGLENERKRFEPWQGGVYGGQITFETGGQIYNAARIFSDKKINDSFDLRDARTNLKSEDFSENLGEEIFRINGESFARTVFLGQNDCVTGTTDSINAKISNLTDNMNDLDCYEKAFGALQEVANKLNPRRKTGLLSKMNDEITRMQTEYTQNASLGESIREVEKREAASRSALEENRRQQAAVFELSGRVSRAQARVARRNEYASLCAAYEQAQERYSKAEAWFPGEVLSEEDLDVCMRDCDAMDGASERMKVYELTPEERRQWSDLSEPEEADFDYAQPQKSEPAKRWIIFLVCGIVLAGIGLGIFFGVGRVWPWILVAAGAALIVAGLVIRFVDSQKAAAENANLEQREREEAQKRASQRDSLYRKQQTYRNCCAEYEEKKERVQAQIRRMGRTPEDDLRAQLQEIWKQRYDWQRAKEDAQTALRRKEEFENENDMSFLMSREETENLPSPEKLQQRQDKLNAEAEEIRDQADAYRNQLTALREKYDEWTGTGDELAAAKEERDRLKKQYDEVRLAQKYLTTAKEAMTAKYMEPLMKSFSEYYRIITGEPAGQYRMDANTNLTVEEQGMQRDTEYLSRGWQDLIGLCLRLALVDAMYPDEKPFLILDEPLVNLDDEKMEGGRRLMEAVSQRYQVIYFTCKEAFG